MEVLLALLVIAFLYSKALITIAIIGLVMLSLFHIRIERIKGFFTTGVYRWFCLVFLAYVISGLYSENLASWTHSLQIKLPFVFLPFAFFLLPKVNFEMWRRLHLWLLAVLLIAAIPVVMQALMNYGFYLDKISKGQAIDTPIEHVKYSMMNAYGMAIGYWMISSKKIKNFSSEEKVIGICSLALFVYLHFLSVRTGLLIGYASIIYIGAYQLIDIKRTRGLLAAISLVLIMPLLSYVFVPSFKAKVGYVLYDWKMSGEGYSDSERIITAKAGWQIFKSTPVFGTGIGDLKEECIRYYRDSLGLEQLDKYPHSQFLYVLAGTGVIGFLIFFSGWFYPFWGNFHHVPLLLLYLNYSLSFFVENSLERSFSVSFFLCFALINISSIPIKLIKD